MSLSQIDGVSFVGVCQLLRLSEQCSALAKDRDPDFGQDEPALACHGEG